MRILLIALLAVAALPALADAATVSRTRGTLRYEAAKGERVSGSITETSGGGFLVRVAKQPHQPRLVAGAGCKHSGPRELRCAGQGVVRLEISLKRARTTSVTVQDVRVPVAARGSGGVNAMFVSGTPDFTYDGGPSRDNVNVESPDGHFTIRLGAGLDYFAGPLDTLNGSRDSTATFAVDGGAGRDRLIGGPGVDSLEGGSGSDSLEGSGGADTLAGGPGTDTVVFTHAPLPGNGAFSVTLDGQRNDGTAGQNAWVGSDVENASILGEPQSSDDLVVGNEGPNVLVGPGTVRGLAGNDILVSDGYAGGGTTLDGGDGDDRIGALAWLPDGGFAGTPATVTCGAGSDVVFTNAAAPADCERANVGMHVLGTRAIGRHGFVHARIDCNDPRGCVLGGLLLRLHGRRADARTARTPAIRIPFGASRRASVQIEARIWKRHRRARSLRLEITPVPQPTQIPSPALSTDSYPRTLTLRIIR
jgi:RTX calcium-binding nonapeptide repeat (4 copies)